MPRSALPFSSCIVKKKLVLNQYHRILGYANSIYLRGAVIVSQNIDDRVDGGKIRRHRDVRTGPGNRLDGTGVGQVGIDGVVVDRQSSSSPGTHRKSLQITFAGWIYCHHIDVGGQRFTPR